MIIGPFWCEKSDYWLRFNRVNDKFVPEIAKRVGDTQTTEPWKAVPDSTKYRWACSYQLQKDTELSERVLKDALYLNPNGELFRASFLDKENLATSKYKPDGSLTKVSNRIKKGEFLFPVDENPHHDLEPTNFDELPFTPEQMQEQQLAQQEKERLQKEKWKTWCKDKGRKSIQYETILSLITLETLGFIEEAKTTKLLNLLKDAVHDFLIPENAPTEEAYLLQLNSALSDPNNDIHKKIDTLTARTDIDRDLKLSEIPLDPKQCCELKKHFIYALFQAERESLLQFFDKTKEPLKFVYPLAPTAPDTDIDDEALLAQALALSMAGQAEDEEPDAEELALAMALSLQGQQASTTTGSPVTTQTTVTQTTPTQTTPTQTTPTQTTPTQTTQTQTTQTQTTPTQTANTQANLSPEEELGKRLLQRIFANRATQTTQPSTTTTATTDPALAAAIQQSLLEATRTQNTEPTTTTKATVTNTVQATRSTSSTSTSTSTSTPVTPITIPQENPKAVALRDAVLVAVAKYLAHHMGQQTHRGPTASFTLAKHGKKGRNKALELKNYFESRPTEEEGQNEINSFICHPDTRFGKHSLVSFVLDELTLNRALPWFGLAPNSRSNRYDRELVIQHIMRQAQAFVPRPLTKDTQANPQPDKKPASTKVHTNIMVLGGFIAVLGLAAVALSLVLLNTATLGLSSLLLIFGVGLAGTLGGIGIFASSHSKKRQIEHAFVNDASEIENNPAITAAV